MDYMIRELKNKIVADLNEAQLPMEVKRLVLTEILKDVCVIVEQLIQEQSKKGIEVVREEEE